MSKYQCACGPKDPAGNATQQVRKYDPYELSAENLPLSRFLRRSIALTCSRCDGRITEVAE